MTNESNSIDRPKLSVMLTCYKSADAIGEMLSTLDAALSELGCTYEIVIVDDGSPDDTFLRVRELYAQYPMITHAIQLLHNVGQIRAITAAIVEAKGEYICNMDTDLQYDPADIGPLVRELEKGYNLVSGVRTRRHDSLLRRVTSRLTTAAVRLMTGLDLLDYGCSLKVFDARVLKAFEFSPMRPFHPLATMVAAGRIGNVPINHRPRKYGVSGWTLLRLYYYFTDLLVGLFQRPAHLGGILLMGVSVPAAAAAVVSLLAGWHLDSVSPLTLLLFGMFMLCSTAGMLLIIFSLLLRTYINTMQHPAYIVRTHLRRDADPGPLG